MSVVLIDPAEQTTASGSGPTEDLGPLVSSPQHVASRSQQSYYATEAWRAGERETLESLRDGNSCPEENRNPFAEWLLGSG